MTTVRKVGADTELETRVSLLQAAGIFLRRMGRSWIALLRGHPREDAHDLRSDPSTPEEHNHLLLRRGRLAASAGDLKQALDLLDQTLKQLPDCGEAIEARAGTLDLMGEVAAAAREFERYRHYNASRRQGAADRHYVLRHPRARTDMLEYEIVMRRVKNRVFPLVAQGNLLLSLGHAKAALAYYDQALRLNQRLPEAVLLRGLALSADRRHAEAIEAFDQVLANTPENGDALNNRAIDRMALQFLDEANADWRRQFELLSADDKAAARACIALRLADYENALPELERCIERQPSDPYWQLYRLTALRRLGRAPATVGLGLEPVGTGSWPAPLLALHAGRLGPDAALALADNPQRRAEASFQLGVLAARDEPAAARRWWQEVVDTAPVDMIEYAAARNELSRLGR